MTTEKPSIESLRVLIDSHCHGPAFRELDAAITELAELREELAITKTVCENYRQIAEAIGTHGRHKALTDLQSQLTTERARADALEAIGRRLSEIFHHEHRSVTILEMDALDKALGITPKEVRDKYPARWCDHDARIRREALEAAWSRLGSANDPLSPGYYVCNSIEVSRWAALEEAMFTATTRDEAGGER